MSDWEQSWSDLADNFLYFNKIIINLHVIASWSIMAPDKVFFLPKWLIFFLFLHIDIHYGYSLEAPHWGASNEYPQCKYSWGNKKNIYLPDWNPD